MRSARTCTGHPMALTGLAILVACGGDTDSTAGRDERAPVPALELTNELQIGSPDDPEYAFGWFHALDVGPDGNIHTLHRDEQAVRVHDGSGRLVRKLGGEGEGPGEFESAATMGLLADTLWVLDYGTYRFTYFDVGTGDLLGSERIPVDLEAEPGEQPPPRPRALLPDGTMLASTLAFSRRVASGDITHTTWFRWTRDAEPIDTLATFPVDTWEAAPPEGGFWSYQRQPFSDIELVRGFPTRPELVRVDRRPTAGDGPPRYRVTKLAYTGDTLYDRRFTFEPVPLTPAMIDSVVSARGEGMAERMDHSAAEIAGWARETLYTPEHLAPVENVVPGRDGSVWIQLTDDGEGSLTWRGLAADGRVIGDVEAPRRFILLSATADRWWGRWSDEFDVPYIVRYDVGASADEQELTE